AAPTLYTLSLHDALPICRGGVGFPDVLLARRAFEELELDRIEVATASHRAGLNLRRAMAALPWPAAQPRYAADATPVSDSSPQRSEEHTSELQSRSDLVC